MERLSSLTAIAMMTLALADSTAHGAEINGLWLVQDRTATVRIAPCGGALCARVATIFQPNDPATGRPWVDNKNVDRAKRNRPLLGLAIATDMKPSRTAGKWVGRVYSIDYGRDYAGSIIQISPTQLKVEGCQLMICESETWTKAD